MNNFSKNVLLTMFRENADKYIQEIMRQTDDYKERAKMINAMILLLKSDFLTIGKKSAIQEEGTKTEYLERVLLINYVAYVVMLEYRNKMWKYDYMSFSRRVGELWEPFCRLPFKEPVNDLELCEPPMFNDVKINMQNAMQDKIRSLSIEEVEKGKILNDYMMVWELVESGGIKLGLDLHFKVADTIYNVDYKSGFSSNEKGNTNRLLLVASIFHSLPGNNKMLMFVRQKEADNNHYLQTLKKSPHWEVYCADEAYEKIKEFSGFDLKLWMNNNMDWENDISIEFKSYLEQNELLKYLTW